MTDLNKLISELNNIKNLDSVQILKILNEHQNTLIKAVLIAGSLVAVGVMFNNYHVKEKDLHAQISQAQEKDGVIKARQAAKEDLKKFESSVPKKLNESDLITLISNYAKLQHVTITSLSPAESKDMGLYDVINVSFDAESDTFKNMILFLRNIEKSESPLRVDSWAGHELDNGVIIFEIQISAVNIHT